MPISWRKLAVAGIAGATTTLAFAAPAAACYPPKFDESVAAECVTETTANVTWTASPGQGETQTLESAVFTIDGQTVKGNGPATPGNFANNSKFTLTVKKTANKAKLTLKVKHGTQTKTGAKEITVSSIDWSKCKAPVVPPAATPSTPAPEQPSTPPVAESPSAPISESPSAPASPTESTSSAVAGASSSQASGSLPVTGTSIGIMAAVATVLLGAGIALFLVAKRRRVRFTAA